MKNVTKGWGLPRSKVNTRPKAPKRKIHSKLIKHEVRQCALCMISALGKVYFIFFCKLNSPKLSSQPMLRQKAKPARRCDRDRDVHKVSLLSFAPSTADEAAAPSSEADSTSPLPNINDGSTLANICLDCGKEERPTSRMLKVEPS